MKNSVHPINDVRKNKLVKVADDPVKSAKLFDLIYITSSAKGITRIKTGKNFRYSLDNKIIKDKIIINRIQKLAIPPAWEDVWICHLENGHLQATGLDSKKRKQYHYHPVWNSLRNHTKYYRLQQFGKILPAIRLQTEKDLSLPGLSLQKVLALVVSLMERTNIRVGNLTYEKLYGSFGITTLKDKHVKFSGNNIKFSFIGKKGIQHDISIKNKKLSNIIKSCRDIPGKELFQFYTPEGERKSIDSGMINDYIKNISGGDFTAKDFRTWSGTIYAFLAFKELGSFSSNTEAKKKVLDALDIVSKHLGNTRNVCKKYYVHPLILSLYENKTLEKYLSQLDEINNDDNKANLTAEEKIVMKILENN